MLTNIIHLCYNVIVIKIHYIPILDGGLFIMRRSRFAKATSIVMSAVVAAAGYSVCAKQAPTASNKFRKTLCKGNWR